MIRIETSNNKTITVTDIETNGVLITEGSDCEIVVFNTVNIYMAEHLKIRTVGIYNKYSKKIIAIVDVNTLDLSSSYYDSDMDTYATNLRNLVLYI